MTSIANGFAKSSVNSHAPRPMILSSRWSTRRHMKSSFSLSRLGVMSLLSRPRVFWWAAASIVTTCSAIGIVARCSSIWALMSSPSGVNGNGGKGPATATQDDIAGSL